MPAGFDDVAARLHQLGINAAPSAGGELQVAVEDASGFDVAIIDGGDEYIVSFGELWHDHFENRKTAIEFLLFGLTPGYRLIESRRGRRVVGAALEVESAEGWRLLSKVGTAGLLLPWPRLHRVVRQNSVLMMDAVKDELGLAESMADPPAALSTSHTFELTRDDWIRFNTSLINESPEFVAAAHSQRRRYLRSLLWWGPLCMLGGALLIGRGASTRGMYLEGAIAGALLTGLMALAFSQPGMYLRPMRARAMKDLHAMDLSEHTGTIEFSFDETGLDYTSGDTRYRFAWSAVAGIEERAGFIAFYAGSSGFIVPTAALGDQASAYLQRAQECWHSARRSEPDRIARYLADRDLGCPKCGYNLRGVTGTACPECGERLTLDGVYEAARRGAGSG